MENRMRAALLTGKETLEIRDVPRPQPGRGQVLIRVHYCGICGSDIHLFQQGLPQPNILGHEFSGVVTQVGPEVEGWSIGDPVTCYPGNPCGSCHWCLIRQPQLCDLGLQRGYGLGTTSGALAEYIVVEASSMRRLPPEVDLRSAPLTEPLAVAMHGVRLSRIRRGDRAVVLGCGTIGLLTVLILSRMGIGALHATDPVEVKRRRALALGAHEAHGPQGLPPFLFHQVMDGIGPDVVFECVGIPQTTAEAVNFVRKGGRVLVLGVCMEPATLLPMVWNFKEIEIKGSYGMGGEFDEALRWIARGEVPVDTVITREVPLQEVQETFLQLRGPNEEGKVLVRLAE